MARDDASDAHSVMRLEDVSREFSDGRQVRRVLANVDLEVFASELTIISGPSGSGKTTLLTIMALILKPSSGRVYLRGQRVDNLAEDALATVRLKNYGFVFQNAALIRALSVMENILMAAAVQGHPVSREVRRRAVAIVEKLGLGSFAHTKADKLSGGQKQRVAIARALINEPVMVLCDEPTSALDVESGGIVLRTLKELSREDRAVVLVTHDPRVFPYADRLIQMEDGRVDTDTGTSR
jgi:putative ABC transport system ATP-binding protein